MRKPPSGPGWQRIRGGFRHEHGWYLLAHPGGLFLEVQKGDEDHAIVPLSMLEELLGSLEVKLVPKKTEEPATLTSVMTEIKRIAKEAGFGSDVKLWVPGFGSGELAHKLHSEKSGTGGPDGE